MISKILIANRGEIACRIIKTCKKLNIKSVIIFSDSDRNCLFVQNADESYKIEGTSVQDTYLNIDKIIAIAKLAQVDAIHPGYGFLSENSEFADKVLKAGIKFIGPSSAAILAMGLKSKAKELMQQALVPILPSYDLNDLQNIEYPVLIKAAAGGGGKGMRIVNNSRDLTEAVAAAKREALKYFANDELIIEKYLPHPRHVEVQILFDNHGNGVYLFERDCSLQRRYQKIIEEAPAPNISANLRAKLGEQALMAGKAVNYSGVGTIEFLLDGENFYFMEMNTRLQVEHPVTELITGLDLVELQIKVANGEALPFKQSDLKIHGHAIEARLYAEDVPNNFLPATGVIKHLDYNVRDDVRIDSGIKAFDEISIYYDPMLAKIIAHGPDREKAILNLQQALDNIHLIGVKNNLAFLSSCIRHESFINAKLSTNFIDNNIDNLIDNTLGANLSSMELDNLWLTAGLYYNFYQEGHPELVNDPWSKYYNWRNCQSNSTNFSLNFSTDRQNFSRNFNIEYLDSQQIEAGYTQSGNSILGGALVAFENSANKYLCKQISINQINNIIDISFDVKVLNNAENQKSAEESRRISNRIIKIDEKLNILYGARLYVLDDKPITILDSNTKRDNSLFAPMPGTIIAINVENGSKVNEGDPLIILEAMKMEHTISAPSTGTVKNINFKKGEQVALGVELLIME